MTIRERMEREEHYTLSKYSAKSSLSKGRVTDEDACPIRTSYQRDRDRIIHCKSFRRLMHKTQVFISPESDHYRTRLTHSIEVSQVAKTIAKALRLNEDLADAIALGHDLGHTPFGHAGERALNDVCSIDFKHAEQSVRIVECLEKSGKGLNLTYEVKNGILCHTNKDADTLEGKVVKYSDKIAYLNHDIDDAMRAKVLHPEDIPWDITYILGRDKTQRMTKLITSLIENSSEDIMMDSEVMKAYIQLREFMFEAVYLNSKSKPEEGKSMDIVKKLFEYFITNPNKLPSSYFDIANVDGKERAVCDYVSGMSDRYAIKTFENIFIPKSWSI